METSKSWHIFKNLTLLILSFVLLPIDTVVAASAYLYTRLTSSRNDATLLSNNKTKAPDSLERATVLVTSVNMAKGLTLARLFHRAGHRVIGADHHSMSLGRVTSCVDVFHQLPHINDSSSRGLKDRYLDALLDIVQREQVDLFVSVSDVWAAVEDATVKEILEARTSVKVIQLGVHHLRQLHDKDTFMEYSKSLGLRTPDTEVVRDRDAVVSFLRSRGGLTHKSGGTQYILKPIGVDERVRFEMLLLPADTEAATLQGIESLPFERDPHLSFIIQEFIPGEAEYCTHALIVHGQVRAFVACPSNAVLLHYTALPPESPLSRAMLDFTIRQAEAGGDDFTGHVSYDFLVKSKSGTDGTDKDDDDLLLYPIECNPRVHTAVVLFSETPELVDEYLSVLQPSYVRLARSQAPLAPRNPQKYYWAGQDVAELFLHPLYRTLFGGTVSLGELYESTRILANHLVSWKDGTFEVWDPLPWWWLYHVYWPMQFARYLFHGRWHKLNLSTGKIFKLK